jgi:hypothetical protein
VNVTPGRIDSRECNGGFVLRTSPSAVPGRWHLAADRIDDVRDRCAPFHVVPRLEFGRVGDERIQILFLRAGNPALWGCLLPTSTNGSVDKLRLEDGTLFTGVAARR